VTSFQQIVGGISYP